jgi:glycosyltransferase involved in cell wall biosynthesis
MVEDQGKKQELSVVLATFNEEKNLPALFDSIKNLADEIVIVDGSSADRTVEIAKKHGAKVVVTENLPNFHINKQKAIDLATKEWILQLDADERVSEELAKEIKSKLAGSSSENGYWIARKNWFLGRFLMKGGQYPDYTLRLYRKGKGYLPQIHVHEQAEVVGSVGYLKHALLHYSYKNFSSYLVKWNRYNDLLASQIVENTKGKNFLVKVGYAFGYLLIKPTHWFLTTYIRHKGFMDGWPGFVFSFFSAMRFPVSYIKSIKLL